MSIAATVYQCYVWCMPATLPDPHGSPDGIPASGFQVRENNSSGRVRCDPLALTPYWECVIYDCATPGELARKRLVYLSESTARPLVLTYGGQFIAIAVAGIEVI